MNLTSTQNLLIKPVIEVVFGVNVKVRVNPKTNREVIEYNYDSTKLRKITPKQYEELSYLVLNKSSILQQLSSEVILDSWENFNNICNKNRLSFTNCYDRFVSQLKNYLINKDNYQLIIKDNLLLINKRFVIVTENEDKKSIELINPVICNNKSISNASLKIDNSIIEYQKLVEKQQKTEESFVLAMRGANNGLWDWNLETDEVYYSPRWKSMLGYEIDELSDTFDTWKNLVHPDDKNIVLAKIQDYLTNQIDSFEVEMRMRHKNGDDVFILSRAFRVDRKLDSKPIRLVGTHVDITQQKKIERYNKKHTEILEMIATGICASEIYNEIALMYEARHSGLRCSLLELKNGILLHGGAPSLPKEYCEAVHGLKNGPNVGSCGTSTYTGKRVLVENIETDPKWAEIKHVALPHGMRCCWSQPIKHSSGKVLGAFGMYYNYPALPNEEESEDLKSAARLAGIVMERDQAQKRIRELAYQDTLTGLASRAHFYQNLEQSIERYQRDKNNFALLYIDLDDFKSVNDTLGHDAGDLLLQEIAQRLKSISRPIDFVARLSGDEFCIIVQNINDEYIPASVAQRCLETILEPVDLYGRKVVPACSIGIARYPDDGNNLSSLIKAADTSLYVAKEKGKNQYIFYHAKLTHQAEYRFRVEQNLRQAVEKQQLSLVYQPQIKIDTGEIIGVEALLRWYHPQLGNISPTEFIVTAEKIGIIKPLTQWVLKTACTQAVIWQKKGFPLIRMAVNISAGHFVDPDFVSMIKDVIKETKILPSQLELEVTETVVQTNEQNLATFRQLKELGVLLAIDDFGTGYSSFASLKHFTVDCLKIDKYFIDDMIVDRKSQLLISSMIEMGHNLEQTIIAEGVETIEQFNLLKKLGCDTTQGYLFSKPVSANQISDFFEDYITNGKCLWQYNNKTTSKSASPIK